jgi:MoaA/NifB/PqqE/SkfB family radical SAM enzyme
MIKNIQIDPNGFCNAKCWFCPVAYQENPAFAKTDMDISFLEDILIKINNAKGIVIDTSLKTIMTAHYNEILLYRYFPEMLDLFRKYNYKTVICSNGIGLTKNKIDLMAQYPDVIEAIHLNIPSHIPEKWSKLVGSNPKILDKMFINIDYAIEKLNYVSNNNRLSLVINGISRHSLLKGVVPLENIPDIDLDKDLEDSFVFFKNRFPKIVVSKNDELSDRAGHLEKSKILKNNKRLSGKVIGCKDSRVDEWLHINALGDIFMCCDDFNFDTIFANLRNDDIVNIWNSNKRQEAIDFSFSSLCRSCSSAIWDN